MLGPDDIAPGGHLKTVTDRLGVPADTFATVDTVGRLRTGEFVFTVRWLNLPSGTQVRPISDRSLNLWESDLADFEAVSEPDISGNPVVAPPSSRPVPELRLGDSRRLGRKRANPNQLSLFTLEDL